VNPSASRRARRKPLTRSTRARLLACPLLCLMLDTACIVRTRADVESRAAAARKREPPSAPPVEPIIGLDGPAKTVAVSVDNDERFQTLEGFGASLGWYMERIVGDTPAETYRLLFPELGLDILRLRNRFERSDPDDANLELEVEIVRRASAALGHRPKLLLSSWSPPAALKASGKEKCHGNADCTLKKAGGKFVYEAFADWWRRSLERYAELGIAPDMMSLQNEPDFIPPDWEGCKFEAVESATYPGYGPALEAVHRALQPLKAKPRLLGPEVLGIHYRRIPNYLAGMNVNLLDAVAHHIYERGNDEMWDWREPGPDSFVDEMQEVKAATTKPLLQTEFGTDEDKGRDGGFETAWLIHNSLVVEGAAGWLYWELIWPGSKGLVGLKGKVPTPRDHYYSLRHYARFTEPGDVRVTTTAQVPALLSSAFISAQGHRLTVVLLNTSNEPLDAEVLAPKFAASRAIAFRTIYRPGQSKQWESISTTAGTLRLPSRSVATWVLER
jgi:glucuronoarabinoxylan endo-1,4-beta-xylanase